MKNSAKSRRGWGFVIVIVAVVLGGQFLVPPVVTAQTGVEGQNAVYYYSSQYPGNCCQGSSAFIDAGPFGGPATDICAVLNGILNGKLYSFTGGVIDARGLPAVLAVVVEES